MSNCLEEFCAALCRSVRFLEYLWPYRFFYLPFWIHFNMKENRLTTKRKGIKALSQSKGLNKQFLHSTIKRFRFRNFNRVPKYSKSPKNSELFSNIFWWFFLKYSGRTYSQTEWYGREQLNISLNISRHACWSLAKRVQSYQYPEW